MKKYKVALIGCGWIGMGCELDPFRPKPASHAEGITQNENLELFALMDINESALILAKNLYPSVPVFNNVVDLFNYGIPDAVVIATHPDSHCHYIKLSSNAGVKLIMSEKPISHNKDEAEEVVELCSKNSTVLIVNHVRRFNQLIKDFRGYVNNQYVRDTAIGKPRVVTTSYDNGLYHGGTHIIDLLRFFLGEVKSVSAIKNHQVPPDGDDIHVDAILQFEECNAMLYYVNSRECAVCEFNIIGERGLLRFRDMWGGTIDLIGTVTNLYFVNHRIPDYSTVRSFNNSKSMMPDTYKHLVSCLEGTETPLCSGADALLTLQVIKAIETSANSNGKVITLAK